MSIRACPCRAAQVSPGSLPWHRWNDVDEGNKMYAVKSDKSDKSGWMHAVKSDKSDEMHAVKSDKSDESIGLVRKLEE